MQPVLFAFAVALAALWRSWGIEPDVVVGHSMGEVAAAYVAGALSLDEAAAIICRRSRLLRQISGQGEMALLDCSPEEATTLLGDTKTGSALPSAMARARPSSLAIPLP